ncbi:MAG: transglutaminase-like domain-containing protein [Planctomycetota bacterium]|jgi:transglutaminase-like putative cysteine protease
MWLQFWIETPCKAEDLENGYSDNKEPKKQFVESQKVAFDICYKVSFPGKTKKLVFTAAVPTTLHGRQKISQLRIVPSPEKKWTKRRNRYVRFTFKNPDKDLEIHIRGRAEIFKYDLKLALAEGKKKYRPTRHLAQYLTDEPKIQVKSKIIQEAAAGIKSDDPIEILEDIHDFVAKHLKYQSFDKALGALEALECGKADCIDFSNLFIALCRAKKIPARWISGYTIDWKNTPKHRWVEVFLRGYGWIPLDPTHNRRKNRNMSELKTNYLYVLRGGEDEELHGRGHYYRRWWGDKPETVRTFLVKKL